MKKRKIFHKLLQIMALVLMCLIPVSTVSAQTVSFKVTMSRKTLYMLPGEKFTLKAELTPADTAEGILKWKTSDAEVAAVSTNGRVTAKKAGTATITVVTTNLKKASCKVVVAEKNPESIKVNKTSLSMIVGDTYTLSAAITPETARTDVTRWSSSNEKVATVKAGLIKAKKAGTTTITVTTSNGKKASCKITVASKKPTKITLNKTSGTYLPEDKCKLTATISPAEAKTNVLTWSSSNSSVATVKNGTVTMKKAGTATITVKTSNGKSASFKVQVNPLYIDTANDVRIKTASGSRTYHKYDQYSYSDYISKYGCVTTAVSIAASGFGKYYSPQEIYRGDASSTYSERYALKQLTGSTSHYLYGETAISTTLAAKILKNMGIPAKVVYQFTVSKAVADMKAHLEKGKPVLLKASNRNVNGVQMANGHHAMVLIGIDEKGMGIFINPRLKRLNYAQPTNNYFKMNLETFVRNHMYQCTGSSYKNPYVTSIATDNYMAGGYILVG